MKGWFINLLLKGFVWSSNLFELIIYEVLFEHSDELKLFESQGFIKVTPRTSWDTWHVPRLHVSENDEIRKARE